MDKILKNIVFLDIQRGKSKIGRVKIQLWSNKLPKTCQNFRSLCTGQYIRNNKPTGFKQSCFYQITSEHMKAGNYDSNNENSGQSIYGGNFNENSKEELIIQQGCNWIISMIKNSKEEWNSLFQIDLKWETQKQKYLKPFGQIVDQNSIKHLKAMLEFPTIQNKPKIPLVIYQCGQM